MNTMRTYVGLDVGKAVVDYHVRPAGECGSVPRTAQGLRRLVSVLAKYDVVTVVLEPTAGYERVVLRALFAAKLPTKLVPPDRGRHFARSLGCRAKTDAIDAGMLAHMAEVAVDDVGQWTPPTPLEEEMRALVHRRANLVRSVEAERKRRDAVEVRSAVQSHERVIRALQREKVRIEKRLDVLWPKNAAFARRVVLLESVQGVGRVVALTLLTEVPELGSLSRTEAAALVGVAPYNHDSGGKQGKRFIRGGRHRARSALYMACFAGIRHNPVIKAHYTALKARGKVGKIALVACMRKLLIHINTLLREALPAASAHPG